MIEDKMKQAIQVVKEMKNSQQVYSVVEVKQALMDKVGLSRPGAGTWLAHILLRAKRPSMYPDYNIS